MKICLVCSSGGHFLQLHSLRDFWERQERFWVTFRGRDTESFLQGEQVYWAHEPTNRNVKNLIRNMLLAVRLLSRERPRSVVTTGAGVAVPFIYVARTLRIRTVYIESLTRVDNLSLSGKLVYPVVDHLLVQWPELAARYGKALYKGQVL